MVKNCTQKTIYIKKNKKIKKFNYYYPPSPLLSLSLLRSLKIEIKWLRKCTTHEYIMQFRTDSV